MGDNTGKQGDKSFWTTIPGILTGCAAVITAIGALITGLSTVGLLKFQAAPTVQATTVAAPPTVQAPTVSAPPTLTQSDSAKLVGQWETTFTEGSDQVDLIWSMQADGSENYQISILGRGTSQSFGVWQYSDGVIYERLSDGSTARGAVRWIDNDHFELTVLDNGIPAETGQKRYYSRK